MCMALYKTFSVHFLIQSLQYCCELAMMVNSIFQRKKLRLGEIR